jgi:hypothetical protein
MALPEMKAIAAILTLALGVAGALPSRAESWAAPGDLRLRNDLQLLNDAGAIDIPLTAWPIAWGDIGRAMDGVDRYDLSNLEAAAYDRLSNRRQQETGDGVRLHLAAGAAENPRIVRSFEDTPREEGELSAGFAWFGERFALNLRASAVSDPFDDDNIRPDDSYIGFSLGNWTLSAGWQQRWWGPGRDGSLILSSNARPMPGIAIQRNHSSPFETKWLRWIGPWSVTSFVTQLDDERVVNDARLFGLRVSFKPLDTLEIGLSRTAQWCGDDRPCDFSAFADLLLGNDNKGVNVDPEEEPGNQLAGLDLRWALPRRIPVALYMQWIGEDSRQGGPQIGSWLRQAGIEYWGSVAGLQHRTHFEVSDTLCREGGFGFSDRKPDCGYEHSIYETGYRYNGRSLGHGADGDGLSYSLGSTWVESAGHSWNVSLRYMEINRSGASDMRHTLSASPQELADIQLTHERLTEIGRFHFGLGVSRLDDSTTGESSDDVTAFIQWTAE